MIRIFYICLLRLHPRLFRERFAGEMLEIFDQASHFSPTASCRSGGSGPCVRNSGTNLSPQAMGQRSTWAEAIRRAPAH